jgi:hypothetical protein
LSATDCAVNQIRVRSRPIVPVPLQPLLHGLLDEHKRGGLPI